MYSYDDVMTFVEEEDIRFIRLAFCDIAGRQKNVAIMPEELKRAFESGISFDASAIEGFGAQVKSDLFLYPDPSTLVILPWRPSEGRVARMFCDIRYPDGRRFELDNRHLLAKTVAEAEKEGISCFFGTEFEFYLFRTDEEGNPTSATYDHAGYFDIAPEDRGENIRREICFTLQDMGIQPEASHHEEGPGQQEIDFKFSDALSAADNAITFKNVVKSVSQAFGAYADFSPKPIEGKSGNGMHINISVKSRDNRAGKDGRDGLDDRLGKDGRGVQDGRADLSGRDTQGGRTDLAERDDLDVQSMFMAGILEHIGEMTAFLNPVKASYLRLGEKKAPRYVTWSSENRSQLIRIPAAAPANRRMELRSPDTNANPYLAFTLLIQAGLDGIRRKLSPPAPTDLNLFLAGEEVTDQLEQLPRSLEEAWETAKSSPFIQACLPAQLIEEMEP